MKILFFFLFILLAITSYSLYMDYSKSIAKGTPYAMATAGEIWIAHDEASYIDYRNQFLGNTTAWERDALPYLNLTPTIFLVSGVFAYMLLILMLWLLSIGPFNHARRGPRRAFAAVDLHRHRPTDRKHPLDFKRR